MSDPLIIAMAGTKHAAVLADMVLEMVESLKQFNQDRGTSLQIRIGLNTGPVVAGVIGRSKFIYDLWGDTVNTASRMESTGLPNRVQVTEQMQQALAPLFDFEERGEVEVKGKGRLRTWFLLSAASGSEMVVLRLGPRVQPGGEQTNGGGLGRVRFLGLFSWAALARWRFSANSPSGKPTFWPPSAALARST